MGRATSKADRIAALCGMIWFIFIIDACFTWFLEDYIRNYIGLFFVVIGTVILIQNQGVKLSKDRLWMFLSVFVLMLFMIITKSLYSLFIFITLLCVVLWHESALSRFYDYFRKFVLFYAALSIFVELLVISKLWLQLPVLTIYEPQDWVQESLGYVNYFYGLFCIPATDTSLTFYRACGPLREGGHFVFFLGFVYFIERVLKGRRNVLLIVCGILTLSPNFLLFYFLPEVYLSIKKKKYFRPLITFIVLVFGLYVLFAISPPTIQDEVISIVYERMLENSIENAGDDGMMAFLDGRIGDDGISAYDSFLKSDSQQLLTGVRSFDGDGLPSDYRLMLMYCGFIGTFLIVVCIFFFSFRKKQILFGLVVLLFSLAIFIQRSWMFQHVYVWLMMLLVMNENCVIIKQNNRLCRYH